MNGIKNIVLLGGSNSIIVDGLQKGLKQNNIKLSNLAVGSTTSIQNFYELKRLKNKDIINNADLIITESNQNEIGSFHNSREAIPFGIIFRNLNWFYKELYFLNKKVLVILFPLNEQAINNIHRKLCRQYGFNIIDLQSYYDNNQITIETMDNIHQFNFITRELGENIVKHIKDFKYPRKDKNLYNDNPQFDIVSAQDMIVVEGSLTIDTLKNSMYEERVCKIDETIKLKFPLKFKNYYPIAIHTWNGGIKNAHGVEGGLNYSSMALCNKDSLIVKESNFLNNVLEIHKSNFQIDENTTLYYNQKEETTEYFISAWSYHPNSNKLSYLNLIAVFVAKNDGNFYTQCPSLDELRNENIEIPNEYNFDWIIPPIKKYEEIIAEYCKMLRLVPINSQQVMTTNEKILGAKDRVKSHLAYKLGAAMIFNSKSILGYIRMLYVLSYIKEKHKQDLDLNSNLKLPKLEDCADYNESLKIKEQLSYQLGQALIKAYNNRWGGGLIKFLFWDIYSIKKKYRRKKCFT